MIANLTFKIAGIDTASYCLDASGQLIRRAELARVEPAIIPGAVEVVSSHDELLNPLAWTLTPDAIEARVAELAALRPELAVAYPGLKVPVSPYPFAPFVECTEPEDMILSAFDVIATHGEDASAELIAYLASLGIFKIPRIQKYNAEIHEAAEGAILGMEVKTLADGWYSHMKIYRRSVVS